MGLCPPYMLFSPQHTTGSWTADPQGSFPSFVAFCSPTLHDKDLIFPIFMDTPEYVIQNSKKSPKLHSNPSCSK